MKPIALILLLTFAITSCSTLTPEFKNAIAFGEIEELNQYSEDVDKSLLLRLLRSPIYQEGCYRETQGVCKYKYFLSVSSFDELPETNVFSLQAVGEITEVKWLATEAVDTAKLELTMAPYTESALKNNPALPANSFVVRVELTPASLKQKMMLPAAE